MTDRSKDVHAASLPLDHLGQVARGEDPTLVPGAEPLLLYRRRTIRFASLLVASSYFIDLFQPRLAEVAVIRALWITALLVSASWQVPRRPGLARFGCYFASVASGLAVVLIVALNGGTASIYSGMLIATPFAVLVGVAELPLAAALNGAMCVLGGAAIRLGEGQPWVQVLCWLLLATIMSALATWGTVAARRAWRIEVGAERERRQALELLAESERRRAESERQRAESERQRAETERLAEVGQIATRVAHEVNNPLAAVKSNVQWLGGLATQDHAEEQAEVVADTLASVQRIVDAVDSIRRRTAERLLPGRE
jgi:signal transduction histidine kinase